MEVLPSVIHKSWHPYLQPVFDNDFQLKILKNSILPFVPFYPEKKNIFNVFSMPMKDIKVVILGQDPYPTAGQAIGYAFAVSETTNKPASLRIIEKEVGHELDRTLSTWREQGVFLLNTALTVRAGEAGSHLNFWTSFMGSVIKIISSEVTPIWFLWGKKAQAYIPMIKSSEKLLVNEILTAAHPAAETYSGGKAGFLGCNHFKKANDILAEYNKQLINW